MKHPPNTPPNRPFPTGYARTLPAPTAPITPPPAATPLAAASLDPLAALEAWPADLPLAACGIGPASRWSQWAVFGIPSGETIRVGDDPGAAQAALDRIFTPRAPKVAPMTSGWIGSLGYELGGLFEPRARRASPSAGTWPAMVFHRCDRVWSFDKASGLWYGPAGEPLPSAPRAESPDDNARIELSLPIGARDRYRAAVARAIEYIRAGDIYQVNLAHRLRGPCESRASALLAKLIRSASPWYGGLLVDDDGPHRRAIVSASPELFFQFDAATRTLTTRPMKGTRPAGERADLEQSPKDRAELAMIVDLMRNDIGRVAEWGSVRVDEPRRIESHGQILQAVSTVSGRLRGAVSVADAVRALAPGGSITGAPKIRAMQIIEELEEGPRGPYCGGFGYVSDGGDACFAMSIRTLSIAGTAGRRWDEIRGTADYWVGAGIVADSTPDAEWDETLVKADAARRAFGLTEAPSV